MQPQATHKANPLTSNNNKKLGTPEMKGSHYWCGDTHFAVSFRIKVDDIVTPVVVSAVHQHGVENVVGRVFNICLLQKLIQR